MGGDCQNMLTGRGGASTDMYRYHMYIVVLMMLRCDLETALNISGTCTSVFIRVGSGVLERQRLGEEGTTVAGSRQRLRNGHRE